MWLSINSAGPSPIETKPSTLNYSIFLTTSKDIVLHVDLHKCKTARISTHHLKPRCIVALEAKLRIPILS